MVRPADITTPTPGAPIESTWGAAVAAASNGVSGGDPGWYEGIATAAGWGKGWIGIRWLTPKMVELYFQVIRTGGALTGNSVGNIGDETLFTIPAEYVPAVTPAPAMAIGILDCSTAFASMNLQIPSGGVTISEVNGAGATIGTNDSCRGHAIWAV